MSKLQLLKKYFSHNFKSVSPSETIIVAGSGRSGTTWLGEIIAACPGFRFLLEPFDYRHVPQATNLPLRPYMRPDSGYPQWESFIRDVLSGNISNNWIDSHNKRFLTWRCLVKAIRANLMLDWISRKFNNKIVYIIRHPCAVVLSRLKLNWETHLDVFLSQQELMEDYLTPYESLIRDAKTNLERHTIMWCVENFIPLKQIEDNNYFFVTYEQLCMHNEKEIRNIFSHLNLKQDKKVLKAMHKKYMIHQDSAIVTGEDKISSWTKQLSQDDIKQILDIVLMFEIDLYNSTTMPSPNFRAGSDVKG